MLYLYTGTPGSGKSLHVAREIVQTLTYSSSPIICNFPMSPDLPNFSRFHFVPSDQLTPQFLFDFAREFWADKKRVKEDYIRLYVDEAQILFNSRSWSQQDRMGWITFLSQHRHFGYRIVFITQFDRMIDRQIRSLAEYEVKHRKFSSFGIKGKIIALLAGGQLFCAVTIYYGMNAKIGSQFFTGRKKYYRAYDSYRLVESGGAEAGGLVGGSPPMTAAATSK